MATKRWRREKERERNANKCVAWIKMLFSSCALKCAYLCGHFHLCLHVNVCVYINLCLFWAAYSDGWQTKKSEKLTKRDKKEYKPNKQRSFAFFYFSRLGIRHKAKHQKRISINKAQSLPRMKKYKTRASKIWMNEWARDLKWCGCMVWSVLLLACIVHIMLYEC